MVCPQRIERDQQDIGISRLQPLRLSGFGAVRTSGTSGQKHSKHNHLDHPALSEG
jgi:hypothetical protein